MLRDSYNKIPTKTCALLKGFISSDLEWQWKIQWHEASRRLSATAELLVLQFLMSVLKTSATCYWTSVICHCSTYVHILINNNCVLLQWEVIRKVKQCFAIRAGDSGIWQTPTLDDSDTSSRAVGFILIYLESTYGPWDSWRASTRPRPMTSDISISDGWTLIHAHIELDN